MTDHERRWSVPPGWKNARHAPGDIMNTSSLTGKTHLRPGAAKRTGRGSALPRAEEGARVAIHYRRSEAKARRTAAECGGAELFRANLESVPEIEQISRAIGR